MKKVFLLILAGGIMMTACKKENLNNEFSDNSFKEAKWILTKSNINLNGVLCDEYSHSITGQKVYSCKESKTVDFDKVYREIDDMGHTTCDGNGNMCTVWIIDKKRYIVIKDGTSPIPYK